MSNDPNYYLPKDAFVRLFDNPIPAGEYIEAGGAYIITGDVTIDAEVGE